MKRAKADDRMGQLSRQVDEYIRDTDISILIRIPEGTQEVGVEAGTDLGCVTTLYLLMQAFITQCRALKKSFGKEYGLAFDWPTIARQLGDMMEEEIKKI